MITDTMPPPSDDTLILLCGPPKMISQAVKPTLDELNYPKETIFTF
jgi:cytochrome-b5 reductase